jgi:hypothetical protein
VFDEVSKYDEKTQNITSSYVMSTQKSKKAKLQAKGEESDDDEGEDAKKEIDPLPSKVSVVSEVDEARIRSINNVAVKKVRYSIRFVMLSDVSPVCIMKIGLNHSDTYLGWRFQRHPVLDVERPACGG